MSDKSFHLLRSVRIQRGVSFVEIDINGELLKSLVGVFLVVGHNVVLTDMMRA